MKKYARMQSLMAFLVGLLFALGMGISGMTQPAKVIHFLQLGPGWDPSLMFVMMGALAVHSLSYRFIRGRKSPLFDTRWHVPQSKEITKSLVVGSALFGLGWGLGGYCPGPGIASAGAGQGTAFIFVAAMLLGMFAFRVYEKTVQRK